MPSNSTKKKSDKSAADPTTDGLAADSVSEDDNRIDLMDALQIGEPGLPPVEVKLADIRFSINRFYAPQTIWRWSDLQRQYLADLPDKASAADRAKYVAKIEATNRELLEIMLPETDHDKISGLLTIVADRSVPEARRIFNYIYNLAGLTDKWGNVLAL